MSTDAHAAVLAALAPAPDDARLPRLGKLAALALLDGGKPVTRSTLVAMSKEVDDETGRRKRGFSEASLKTNGELRMVYLNARTTRLPATLRRRGKVSAQVARMTKAGIATALIVGRMAAAEREEEHRLALEHLGEPHDAPAVARALAMRRELPVNRTIDAERPARIRVADLQAAVAAENAAAIERARGWAAKRGIRATAEWVASRCGIHPGTVERAAMRGATNTANENTFDFEVPLPPALMRHSAWDLARALVVERTYIKALHAATMEIGLIIIDSETIRRRAHVRAAKDAQAQAPSPEHSGEPTG